MEDKEFTPEEENNDGSKKKNKLWILIICFLAVILVIGGFSINSYIESLSEDDDKNEESIDEKKEETKVDSKYSGMYVIYDETRIYTADVNEFLVSGKKTEVVYDAYDNQTIKVFKNKIFYFNDTERLVVYDMNTKQKTIYDFEGIEINWATLILPGEDYTIVSDLDSFVRIDMNTKQTKYFNLNTNNYTILYDDSEKILYYMNNYNLESYDVVSGIITENIANGQGHPVYFNENYLYINREVDDEQGISSYYFDIYNRKTKEVITIKKEFGHFYEYLSTYKDDIYFFGDGRLTKIDKDLKKAVICSYTYSEVRVTNFGIFIKNYDIEETEDEVIVGEGYVIYEYDYEAGKQEIINNQYVSDLFDYSVYYIGK